MKILFPIIFTSAILGSVCFSFKLAGEKKVLPTDNDSIVFSKIYSEGYNSWAAYIALEGLCKKAPKRLAGSAGAQVAVEYMEQVMRDCQFDKVWLQPVMVPHWERGPHEIGYVIDINGGKKHEVNVTALGGSIGTGENGLTAEVIEVTNFDELENIHINIISS